MVDKELEKVIHEEIGTHLGEISETLKPKPKKMSNLAAFLYIILLFVVLIMFWQLSRL